MKKSTQWGTFIRRMSVFYIFLAIIVILFLTYFYYYVPANENEFNDRATRELKKITDNFRKKSADVDSIFSQANLDPDGFKNKSGPYQTLSDNIPYEADSSGDKRLSNPTIIDKNEWNIEYPIRNTDGHWKAAISMNEFAEPLFKARNDVFESYVILSLDSNKQHWDILFKHNEISPSEHLNLDTLKGLQKNSDLSAIIDLVISGNHWKLFFSPFDFHDQKMALGGLISNKEYRGYIRDAPVPFIASCIIVLIIVLIFLPVIKVYFLSPNETISSGDILLNTVSIFCGTSAILVILLYMYIHNLSEQSFQTRMRDLAGQMKADIDTELAKANAQLDYYSGTYARLTPSQKKILYYDTTDKVVKKTVDSLFCPVLYSNMTRVLWVDSAGNTLAKWNPFIFSPPFSNVKNYEFFKRLKTTRNYSDSNNILIVYPGKSNVTGEYQVYIAKPDRQYIQTRTGDSAFYVRSMGILLATSLNCNILPVLPPGFGFCIVDQNGNVLVHSDRHRNLSENIFLETRENQKLLNAVTYRNNSMVNNAVLYGIRSDLYVTPVSNQPLSLIIFFDKKSIDNNITRFLHFSITCLMYLFVALALCILVSTYAISRNPSKIKFDLHKIEWIRPSAGNNYSYDFVIDYFKWLAFSGLLSFAVILLFRADIRNILYLSLMLPLFTIWGFIASRKHLVNKYHGTKAGKPMAIKDAVERICLDVKTVWLILLLFNLILWFYANPNDLIVVTIAQLFFIFLLILKYQAIVGKIPEKNKVEKEINIEDESEEGERKKMYSSYRRKYLHSLYLSLLLISILPTLGIIVYSFFSEKIQYRKKKELFAAEEYSFRRRYLENQLAKYKPEISLRLSSYFDTLINQKSIYLSDRDRISFSQMKDSNEKNVTLYDEPYGYVTDNLYQYTWTKFGEFTIKNYANDRDTSWRFTSSGDSIILHYSTKENNDFIRFSSWYSNPLYNFFHVIKPGGLVFILILILFLFLEKNLIRLTMTRLFLLNFSRKMKTDENYIENFFLHTPKNSLYCGGIDIPHPLKIDFFKKEEEPDLVPYDQATYFKEREKYFDKAEENLIRQEDYILGMTHCFAPVYKKIWEDQSDFEKYFLFDLAKDGYSNYKNTDIIFGLITKGIIIPKNFGMKFFSLSFRNFLLGKKGTPEIEALTTKFGSGGMWQSIRTPFLVITGGFIVFFVTTQNELAQNLAAFITSLAALTPVIVQFISKGFSKSS